jgi:hypothetical protein
VNSPSPAAAALLREPALDAAKERVPGEIQRMNSSMNLSMMDYMKG